jgi:hypothetical protein
VTPDDFQRKMRHGCETDLRKIETRTECCKRSDKRNFSCVCHTRSNTSHILLSYADLKIAIWKFLDVFFEFERTREISIENNNI